jgi:hypothetical protein
MDSQGTHDFINIGKPQSRPLSRAPSMHEGNHAQPHNSIMAPRPQLPVRKHAPQRSIDEFWAKFTTKHPGKIFTILPDNLYAKRAAAHTPKGSIPGVNALASYEEAVESCRKKVAKIVKECRRLNQKYRDPHFDIEADFKRSQAFPEIPADCLSGLDKEQTDFQPMSVKRVEVRSLSCVHLTYLTQYRMFSRNRNSSSKARPPMTFGKATTATAGSWPRSRPSATRRSSYNACAWQGTKRSVSTALCFTEVGTPHGTCRVSADVTQTASGSLRSSTISSI